jgi:hypothetical protein
LYISSNGFISFDSVSLDSYFGPDFSYPNNLFTVIAPFWSNVNITRCGSINAYETISCERLSEISADIRNRTNVNFRATWAYVVTYSGVCPCCVNSLDIIKRNSFQVVITTDGYTSYTIFNFNKN